MIDFANLPLSEKTYRNVLKTVISPEEWSVLWANYKSGIRGGIETSDEELLKTAGFPALYTAKALKEDKVSGTIELGTWAWILGASEDEASVKAAVVSISNRENMPGLKYLDSSDMAHAWNEGDLYGPNAKARTIDPYRDVKTLVITHVGSSHLREEADALLALLEYRRRNRETTILASSLTSKSLAHSLIHAGSDPKTVQQLLQCISDGIKDSRSDA